MVKEIRQRFTDWATQVIRLYRGEEFLELEWIIGPVPTGTTLGKEVVSIFFTNVSNSGIFFTDSNGRQMMKRTCWNETTRNPQKKPVASCYYPVVSRICLHSTNTSVGLCVLTDRPQGGTSYNEGEIELMVHRRLLTDDGFGLEESLNEEAFGVGLVVKGKHRLVFGNIKQEVDDLSFTERVSSSARRWLYEPWLFMTAADKINKRKWQNVRNKRYSALRLRGLPRHIHVLTLEPWKAGSVLLRLENTLEKPVRDRFPREQSDGPEDYINKPSHITVHLRQMFGHLKIRSVRETTLAANQWLDDARQMDWSTRYVYQGSEDEILPEDMVDYKEDKSTVRQDEKEEKLSRELETSDEEERRSLLTKHEKRRRIRKNRRKQQDSDQFVRNRRSVNVTANVLENVINSTFDLVNNTDINTPNADADNFPRRVINESSEEEYETSTRHPTYVNGTSRKRILENYDNKEQSLNMKNKNIRSGKFYNNARRHIIKDIRPEEDYVLNIRQRGPKRRKKTKIGNEKDRKGKAEELDYSRPDDGITRSIYEMYYKSNRQSGEKRETRMGKKNMKNRNKMRRYKNGDYPEFERSCENGCDPEIDQEDQTSGTVRAVGGEEGERRRQKLEKKEKSEKPSYAAEERRYSKKRERNDENRDNDEKDETSKTERSGTNRRDEMSREEEWVESDEETGGDQDGYSRRKRSVKRDETKEVPTAEAMEPSEEPDYTIILRPTQIRTFVIFFETNFIYNQ